MIPTSLYRNPDESSSSSSLESLRNYRPKNGWVVELDVARKEAKKNQNDFALQFRVARAHHTLRQWEHCKVVSKLALSLLATSCGTLERVQRSSTERT